ncbi:MAG: hypothetical protein H7276_03000 [Caulobacter sp.]|nr:hypothetical protein [Vitreoscilla sp.]
MAAIAFLAVDLRAPGGASEESLPIRAGADDPRLRRDHESNVAKATHNVLADTRRVSPIKSNKIA